MPGPAFWAASAVSTKMPVPMMAPMPSMVSWNGPSERCSDFFSAVARIASSGLTRHIYSSERRPPSRQVPIWRDRGVVVRLAVKRQRPMAFPLRPARARARAMLARPRGPARTEGARCRAGNARGAGGARRAARARPPSFRWSCWPRPGLAGGKIIVLEPRRLAARAAAERMATTLGEKVGETVGYRVRMQSQRVGRDPHRGGHRGRLHPHDPGRPRARRRRLRDLRRVPRAQPATPTWAWPWPATRNGCCATTCASWSCRPPSTARRWRGCWTTRR